MQSITVKNTEQQYVGVKNAKKQSIGIENEYTIVYGEETYEGDYIVEPDFVEQVLETKNKIMSDNVSVLKIRVSETANQYGTTIYIGKMGV